MARNIYWHEPDLVADGVVPTILAIGDSWFWPPLPGGSLATPLAAIVAARGHAILAFGHNGAEAFDYVNGVYAAPVERALDRYGEGLGAVFLSGAGHDFAGWTDLRPLLGRDCSTCATAAECLQPERAAGELAARFDRAQSWHIELIDLIAAQAPAAARIFLHSYDYAQPARQGVIGSGWLRTALDAARVPPALKSACVRTLVDALADRLQALEARYAGRVVFVDSRGTLGPGDWANELHPSAAGFERIAQERWRPALVAAGLA